MRARIQFTITLAAALGTCSCLVGPKYVAPTVATGAPTYKEGTPVYFKEAPGWKQGTPQDAFTRGNWWEVFGDKQLNGLMQQIEPNNPTLAMAEANYRGARAAIRVTRSELYPTLTAGASLIGSGTSGPVGGGRGGQAAYLTFPTVGATWEPDLWGAVRRAVEANVDTAQATEATLENTRLSLQSTLALDYFQLRGLDTQKQLLDTTVKAYEKALELTQNRYNQGIASQVDVAQAQTQLAQTQAQSTDTMVMRQQFEHAIAILIGKPPSELTVEFSPIVIDPPSIPGVLPSELLERRPDIASNERQVASANAQIGVQIAAYYPTLTLGASGGFEGTSLLNLFTWPARFWSIGPSISETILDFGKRRGLVEGAEANYDAAVATYRQTVLTAFQQVEDQLAALRILEEEAKQQADAVRYAERSLELANAQYQGGITTYLQVITAQETALQNEVTAVQLKTRRMTASVSLIQALGGGWDRSKLPTPNEVTPQKPAKVATGGLQ
jgi:NodT family efflux transporter outer membrane factor (OMF) lipoprotein